MRQYSSHREILETWKSVPVTGRKSWFYVLARDLKAFLPVTITYYTVRRWWERDNIPIEYHSALIAAANARGFEGITNSILAGIKTREMLSVVSSNAA